MKKLAILLTIFGLVLMVAQPNVLNAQDDDANGDSISMSGDSLMANDSTSQIPTEEETGEEEEGASESEEKVVEEDEGLTAIMIQYFIDGGPLFMGIVLITLILGLAFVIERIISLTLASTNVKSLMRKVENKLQDNDVDGAKEICKSNRSPIASIIYQGLERSKDGIENVEKAIVAYGSVQMGLLERGLVWIQLFIALAPMLGFMGTIIGMVQAFESIREAGDIDISVVSGDIKVALLTTLFGLIVAVILQTFYNFIVSKIDGMVNDMEEASISFVDMLMTYNITGNKN